MRHQVMIALLLLPFPPQLFGQVLRDPPTPYHFLRYDDVPADQQSPAWPHDFWAPIKFIPHHPISRSLAVPQRDQRSLRTLINRCPSRRSSAERADN
jgi:hypothetical protein